MNRLPLKRSIIGHNGLRGQQTREFSHCFGKGGALRDLSISDTPCSALGDRPDRLDKALTQNHAILGSYRPLDDYAFQAGSFHIEHDPIALMDWLTCAFQANPVIQSLSKNLGWLPGGGQLYFRAPVFPADKARAEVRCPGCVLHSPAS